LAKFEADTLFAGTQKGSPLQIANAATRCVRLRRKDLPMSTIRSIQVLGIAKQLLINPSDYFNRGRRDQVDGF
jgi:hypothetical protein